MSNLLFKTIPDAELERALTLTPHATVFNQPSVLSQMAERVEWWGVRRGPEWLLLWPIVLDHHGRMEKLLFAKYLGPIYTANVLADSQSGQLQSLHGAWRLALQEVLDRYPSVDVSLPLGMEDVRPLVWAASELGLRIDVQPCYTGVLENLPSKLADLEHRYSRSRKRAVGRARQLLLSRTTVTVEDVFDLYLQPLLRQGNAPEPTRLTQLRRVFALANGPCGITLGYRRPDQTRIVGLALLLNHRDTANGVVCVADETLRPYGATAWILHDAIREAISRGARRFDFNGANTRDLAFDRALYGAHTRLYFRVMIQRA